MNITLIGWPGRMVDQQDLVMTLLESRHVPKHVPKGMPTLPSTPMTSSVTSATKQCVTVAEAIQHPEDALIVDGFAAYDPCLKAWRCLPV